MRRSNRIKWSELKVGILVMLAFGLMMWASIFGGGTSLFQQKNFFHAHFNSVNGLTTGSPVWLQGVEVGNVKSISFDSETRKIEVVGKVTKNVWHMVTVDSKVKIGAIGLIGDKFLQLIPGSPTAPVLEHNGFVEVIEDDIDKIFREGSSALENINALAADLKEVLGLLANGEGTIGKLLRDGQLYDNANSTLTELSSTLEKLNKNQDRVFDNLERSANSLSELTNALTDSSGTVGRLLFDTTLYTNLTRLTGTLGGVLAKVDSGQGALGQIVNDAAVYDGIRDLLARAENLLLDMETNPKKYFKVSVF